MRDLPIVVAGGSGGLGSATVRMLTGEGAQVAISYRSNRARAETIHGVAAAVQADLSKAADRAALLGIFPAIYGLAIFAGDPARVTDPAAMEDSMRRSHQENYLGPVLLAREAAERMKTTATRGAIVLIASMQAVSVFAGSTAYAAQKAALMHAGKVLAKECRGNADIRVNIVCPGVNRAGMAEASIASGKYDRYLNEGIISRFGSAEDVARAVRFFLEPDNYITGQVLTVDGGLTL